MTHTEAMKTYRKSAQAYPLIGYMLYWSVRDFRIPFREFMDRMKKAGIPEDLAKETSAKSALVRAIKDENKGKKNKFHRKLVDGDKQAAFAVVHQNIDQSALEVDFQKETTAILDKENQSVRIEGFNSDEIRAKFNSIKETYSADQFRNVILKYLAQEAQAVSIRERGGVYFVPISKQAELDKLEKFFDLFAECDLEIVPVVDMAQAKKSMWKALVGEVEYEIKNLREEIAGMGPEVSDKVLERRVQKTKELADKVSMYEDLLQGTAKQLNGGLKEIQTLLREKLA